MLELISKISTPKMPSTKPAGQLRSVDIMGCHKKVSHPKKGISPHGSIYLSITASVICKDCGAVSYRNWPSSFDELLLSITSDQNSTKALMVRITPII